MNKPITAIWKKRATITTLGTVIVFGILFVFFSILSPAFLSFDNLIGTLRQVAILAIVSLGLTFVIIAGQIDLSVGSIVGLSGIFCTMAIAKYHMPVGVGILAAVLAGGVMGLLNGLLITVIRIPALIATLGTLTIFRGVTFIISKGQPIYALPESFLFLGRGYIESIPVPVLIMVVFVVLFFIIQKSTSFSVYIYAIGGNRIATRLSGINDKRYINLIFIISGLLTGFGGAMLASRLGSGLPTAGSGFELTVVTAVLIGGTSINGGIGSIFGTLFGCLIIGFLQNGLVLLNIHSYYQMVVNGLILLIAVGMDTIRQKERL
jgi:ribose transport system permease protein